MDISDMPHPHSACIEIENGLIEEIRKLQSENSELKAKLDEAVEALEKIFLICWDDKAKKIAKESLQKIREVNKL